MEIECPAPGCGYKTPAIEATAAIQLLQMHNNTNHMATASTSAAASSVPNISVNVVNQNTNTNVNVNQILVKNQVMKLGFDKEEDAQKFLNFLGEDSPDRTERLQKFVRLTEDKRLRLPSVNTLTRSVCLIRYRGASGKWHGTGFLAKVPGNGVALLSAGHNFEDKRKLLEEFENFTFLFDHTDGVLYPKTSTINVKNMKELMSQFNCDVIITFQGQQLIKKNGKPPIIRPHKNEDLDYFILHFTNADAEEKLRSQNLDFLEIDPGKNRKPKGEPVYIFGYPRGKSCLCCKKSSKCKCRRMPTGSQCSCKEGCFCDEEPGTCTCTAPCHHPTELCQCQHPLRFSHGNLKQKEGEVRMKYDMDTEEGNSGSPISGAEYTVEGIHVSTSGKLNTAQSIKPVLEDLQTILGGDCDTSEKTSKSKGFLSGLFFQEKFNLDANETNVREHQPNQQLVRSEVTSGALSTRMGPASLGTVGCETTESSASLLELAGGEEIDPSAPILDFDVREHQPNQQLVRSEVTSGALSTKMMERPYYMDYSPMRMTIHKMVTSKYFDLAISAVIGLNVITMAMEFYMMPKELEFALKVFNYFFTGIFILEAGMKISALGFSRYRWNQLDIGIVFLSILGIILEELEREVMIVLRIAKVLKLLKMARGIRALVDTVMQALPQVGNLGLLFFIFAALGVEMFGCLDQVDLKCADDYTKLVQLHSTNRLSLKATVNSHVDGSIEELTPILKCLTKANHLVIMGKIELTASDCLLLEKFHSTTQLTIEASISFNLDRRDNSIQSLSPLLHLLTRTNQLVITADGLHLKTPADVDLLFSAKQQISYSLQWLFLSCEVSNLQEEWVAKLITAVPVVGLEPGFKLTDNICDAVWRRMSQGGTQLQALGLSCDLVNVRDNQFSCLVSSVSEVHLYTKVSQSQALGLANRLEGQGGNLVRLGLDSSTDGSAIRSDTLARIFARVNQL